MRLIDETWFLKQIILRLISVISIILFFNPFLIYFNPLIVKGKLTRFAATVQGFWKKKVSSKYGQKDREKNYIK